MQCSDFEIWSIVEVLLDNDIVMGFVTGPTHISVGSSLNITSNANCSISSLFDVLNVIKRVFSMSAIIWLQESKAPSTVFCNKSIFLSKTLLDLKQSKSSPLILATLYSKLSSADRILSSLSLSSGVLVNI